MDNQKCMAGQPWNIIMNSIRHREPLADFRREKHDHICFFKMPRCKGWIIEWQ